MSPHTPTAALSEPAGVMTTGVERYRAILAGCTPEGDSVTLIVTRRPDHQRGPVWVTFGSTVRSTVALLDGDVGDLIGLLRAAQQAGGCAEGSRGPSRAAVEAAAAVITDGGGVQRMLQAAYDVDRPGHRK
jgi:hypothetical protein